MNCSITSLTFDPLRCVLHFISRWSSGSPPPLLFCSPEPSIMERAARLIKNNTFSKKVFSDEDFARAVWPMAVGKAIASHTSRIRLVRAKLVIDVEDAIWQRQL